MFLSHHFHSTWLLFAICLFCYGSLTSAEDDLPIPKLSLDETPTLKFLYCYSCGYKKMFDQYSQIIAEKYPYILVNGTNFQPSALYMLIVRIISTLKLLVIVCILGGINMFDYFNVPQPSWWQWCTENKIYACMMLFFLCNLIEGQLMQSGAFEISLNDVPIWSKLESGRFPQPPELFQIIDSHIQFMETKIETNGYVKQ